MTRTELIHSICSQTGFVSKALRGNTLWTLWENENHRWIVCDTLTTEGRHSWISIRETEETPPKSLTCPKNFLTKTAILCQSWRDRVEAYENKRKGIKGKIKVCFKEANKTGKTLRVSLKPEEGYSIPVPYLDVVSITPGIEGRYDKTGLRYKVPLKLVDEIILLEK